MQTGHIYRKGDSWFLLFKEPQSVGGKKKWRNKVVKLTDVSDRFRTERSVRDAKLADKYLQSVVQTDEGSTQLVRDFIEHVYLKTIQRRPSTMNGYENIFTKHLKDRLGDIRMLDFRTSHGHKLLERIAQEEPHLAHSSLKHIKHFLNGVFTHALRQGTELPTGNPMRDAGIPEGVESEDTYAYSLREIRSMLGVLSEPAKTVVACAAFTGLRRSELRGLRWADLIDDKLYVNRTVWESQVEERTKTKRQQGSCAGRAHAAEVVRNSS